jgi:arsenite methyltransferase
MRELCSKRWPRPSQRPYRRRMADDIDRWAAWLLHRRDGDDTEQHAKALEHLLPIRDRVIEGARLRPGDVVLDVGAGDGLIAFAALDAVRPGGRVIFSDVSNDLLARGREIAAELAVGEHMDFVEADAADLRPIADRSVDVVMTRSVLIYVADKAAAFRAFHRVLRPGGRLSIFEPINNYFPESPNEYWGFDAAPVADLVAKVWAHEGWDGSFDAEDPMMNFTEKDLLRLAEDAGFGEVHVELRVDVAPGTWVVDWERLLTTSPNPNASTAGEALRGALTVEEYDRFEAHMRPLVDSAAGVIRSAFAYVSAVREA